MVGNTVKSNVIINIWAKMKEGTNRAIQSAKQNVEAMNSVGRASQPMFKQMTNSSGKFTGKVGAMNTKMARGIHKVRMFTHGLKGFKMEMLGVMFFGMMLARTFSQMLRPASEMLGIFELWTLVMAVLFLPIMIAIYPYILKFMEWLMDLSPATKLAIGIVVLLGLAFGIILFVIGSLALGLGALIVLFSSPLLVPIILLGYIIALVFGGIFFIARGLIKMFQGDFFGGLSDVFIGIGLFVATFSGAFALAFIGAALVVKGFVNVFEGDMEGLGQIIMGVGLILFMFIGWWAIIPIAVGAGVYLIIKHWDWLRIQFWKISLSITKALKSIPLIGRLISDDTIAQTEQIISTLEDLKKFKEESARLAGEAKPEEIISKEEFLKTPEAPASSGNKGGLTFEEFEDLASTQEGLMDDKIASLTPTLTVVTPPTITEEEFDVDKAVGELNDLKNSLGVSPTINNTNNFYGFTQDDQDKALDERDKGTLDKLLSMTNELMKQ